MTRKEINKYIKDNKTYPNGSAEKCLRVRDLDFLLEKMNDDFENRRCENCEYYYDDVCNNEKVDAIIDYKDELNDYMRVIPSFGCNKFVLKI